MSAKTSFQFNLEGKVFTSVSNTDNGEVDERTVFEYHQNEGLIFADYSGGLILKGHLIGKIVDEAQIEFCYQHVNLEGEIMAGKCHSLITVDENGKLKMTEDWQWFTGDQSSGRSEVLELR